MDILMIVVIAVHAASGVFWAGSTGAMANLGGAGGARLFPFQMGSAGVAVLTGVGLWAYWRGAAFNTSEQVLALGIATAIIAAAIQGNMIGGARRQLAADPDAEPQLRSRIGLANRIAAGLLVITVVCMVISRYF